MQTHVPVMLKEAIEYLVTNKSGIYIDATYGRGGHTAEILKNTNKLAKVLALDQDQEAINECKRSAQKSKNRLVCIHSNFADLSILAREQRLHKVDGILFDLGVSSPQVDTASRGFSFKQDAPLDMRMNQTQELTAADLLAYLNEQELTAIFYKYGEESYAKKIAKAIVYDRETSPFTSTRQLADLVARIKGYKPGRHIHPATKVFQALRIAVNNELANLELGLNEAIKLLGPGGRIVVISFHSLEDRIVKNIFREQAQLGTIKVVTKKPLEPSMAELQHNPRARSAKMRVAVKN